MDIGEDLQAYVLASAFESGDVVGPCDEGGTEDGTLQEEIMHPGPARKGGHDVGDEELTFVLGNERSLLGLSDMFAI